jgi:hypothetical protein
LIDRALSEILEAEQCFNRNLANFADSSGPRPPVRKGLTLRFTQTDAGSSAVLCDEFDAGRLQNTLNGFEVIRHRNRSPSFKISNCTFANRSFGSEVRLRKLDQGARGAALSGCHLHIVVLITIFNKDTE